MCGIIGVISTEGMKNRTLRKEFMLEGLTADSWRGWDSTGLAIVTSGQEQKEPIVYKRAVNGFDFIQLAKTAKLLDDVERYTMMIGHNRSATRGSITDKNAHPFTAGRITLVHNGTINNVGELGIPWAQWDVDSQAVAIYMDEKGEKPALEKIFGAFTLVWHNSEDGTFNIARNDRKPLFMVFAEKENTMYFGSEDTLLWHLLARRGVDLEGDFMFPTPGVHYKYSLKDLREYKKFPFALCQGWQKESKIHTPYTETDNLTEKWKQGVKSLHGETGSGGRRAHGAQSGTPTTTSLTELAGISDKDETEEIRRHLSQQRLRDYKRAGRPTAAKRIERATNELKKFSLGFGEPALIIPEDWIPYRNQRDFGTVIGFLKRDPTIGVQLYNIRSGRFREYQDHGSVFASAVNVRRGPANKLFVVAEEHPRMEEIFSMRKRRQEEAQAEKEHQAASADPQDSSKRVELLYRGPANSRISLGRFLELTKHGCGNCSQGVTPNSSEKVMWMGEPPTAICADCVDLPIVQEALGLITCEDVPYVGNVH